MNDELILNTAYFAGALCIMYKMAWIARMVAHIEGWQIIGLRFAGVLYALVVLMRASYRFLPQVHDPASLFDVGREFTMCIFLFMAIAVLRLRTGRW